LCFSLLYRTARLTVRVTATDATYTVVSGDDDLVIRHHGEQLVLAPKESVTRPLPPAPDVPAPTQPAGRAPAHRER
jgi:alpha,alpha-trehalose phosphorylase